MCAFLVAEILVTCRNNTAYNILIWICFLNLCHISLLGSCLADHLADASHNVLLWSRTIAVVKALNSTHTHPTCHKGHVFPESVRAVGPDLPMKETLDDMNVFVFAVPTEGLRWICNFLKCCRY